MENKDCSLGLWKNWWSSLLLSSLASFRHSFGNVLRTTNFLQFIYFKIFALLVSVFFVIDKLHLTSFLKLYTCFTKRFCVTNIPSKLFLVPFFDSLYTYISAFFTKKSFSQKFLSTYTLSLHVCLFSLEVYLYKYFSSIFVF